MAEDSNQEKTEQATPHRREEARKKGQVARSMELNSFAILFFGLLFLVFTGPSMVREVAALMRDLLSNLTALSGGADSYIALIFHLSLRCLLILAPLFVALLIVGVLINAAQVGFTASVEVLQPKLDKLNFTRGLQRLFSRRSLVELIRDLLKLAIIGVVAWFAVKVELDRILTLSDAEPAGILTVAAWAVFGSRSRSSSRCSSSRCSTTRSSAGTSNARSG